MTTIHAHGGLANRLRAIISWRHFCGPITVAWKPDGQVFHERFTDAFKPLPGVEFIDTVPSGAISTYEPHPQASGWERDYLDLQPLSEPPVESKEYAAVHMRRTDAIAYQQQCNAYEDDGAFLDWCERVSAQTIFLATDNGTTQYNMADAIYRLGKQPWFHRYIPEHGKQDEAEVRNTPLIHAVWDIYTCVRAAQFKGSGASSFTNLIHTLRSLR